MREHFKYKDYIGSINVDLEENILFGEIEFINDLVTFSGSTITELQESFKDAVDDYLETCIEIGKEPDKPFSGTFNIRIGQDLHREVAIRAKMDDTSINDIIKLAVTQYLTQPEQIIHKHFHVDYSSITHKNQQKYWYGNAYIPRTDEVIQWKNQM